MTTKTMTLIELSSYLKLKLESLVDLAKEQATIENFLNSNINYRVTNVYSFIKSYAELTSLISQRIESFGENSLNEDTIKKVMQRSEHLIDSISTEIAFIKIEKDKKEFNLN